MQAQSAVALAQAIRTGQTTARQAVEACIERIEAFDPAVNAVVQRRFEQARQEADQADARLAAGEPAGPLHGVPITIKDQFNVAGLATTVGLASRKDLIEGSDGPLVGRLRQAGAIVLGKTNVFQLLVGWETVNPVFGPTNNPWNLTRTPGGSSGGEAAVIAYGGSALGLGGDFGGSIRVPAAFCGVCGLKPTAHRLTQLDTPGDPFDKQEAIIPQPGPIAATVEDLAFAMRVLTAGRPDAVDASLPPVAWVDSDDDPSRLRVGWFCDNGLFTPSPAIRRAVREAAEILGGGGARVVPVQPPNGELTDSLFSACGRRPLPDLTGCGAGGEAGAHAQAELHGRQHARNGQARGEPRPQEHWPDPALPSCWHTDALDSARVLPPPRRTAPALRRHDGRLGPSRDRRGHLPGVRAAGSVARHNERPDRGDLVRIRRESARSAGRNGSRD